MWEMDQLPEPTPENVAALRDQMNVRHINYLVAYTAADMGSKRLQGTLALIGDQLCLLGKKKSSCSAGTGRTRSSAAYTDNEYLDEEELDRIEAGVGRDRVTVYVYAYTP
jgi:hypothetical protein